MIFMDLEIKKDLGGAWLAQTLEHTTLGLRIMGSSPTLGIELPLNKSGGGGYLENKWNLFMQLLSLASVKCLLN